MLKEALAVRWLGTTDPYNSAFLQLRKQAVSSGGKGKGSSQVSCLTYWQNAKMVIISSYHLLNLIACQSLCQGPRCSRRTELSPVWSHWISSI